MLRTLPTPTEMVGRSKWDLDTPALCIDLDAMERNIQRMATFLREATGDRVKLRPHIKTHKTPEIAWLQIKAGAIGLTCQKVGEAEVMAQAGIRDLLITNQVVSAPKIARLMALAQVADPMVAVDDARNVADLSAAAREAGVTLRVVVEVNHGMNRAGVEPGPPALDLARRVADAPGLRFMGLHAYEGHTVMIPDYAERKAATEKALAIAMETKALLEASGLPAPIVTGGGAGTYDITARYPGVTEIQAGSYITMDAQYKYKVGLPFECALTVLTTILSRPRPGVAVGDSGLKVVTSEFGLPPVVGIEGAKVVYLSEEHTRLEVTEPQPALVPGAKIELLPTHGCTTFNLHDWVYGIRGDRVESVWRVAARGRSQ